MIRLLLVLSLLCACSPELPLSSPAGTQAVPDQGKIQVRLINKDVTLDYVVRGRYLITEGDMIITSLPDTDEELHAAAALNVTMGSTWPGGIVPYVIDPKLPDSTVQDIRTAIANWNTSSSIRLIPRTTDRDYVNFTDSGRGFCQSFVGRVGGPQIVDLAPNCGLGAARHEIGHALGLFHEQSRSDRDAYVDIFWPNIKAGKESNFNKYPPGTGWDIGGYNYQSLMHYESSAFSANGMPTILAKNGSVIARNNAIAPSDYCTISFIYFRTHRIPTGVPAPADYDGDGKVDLSVKDSACEIWLIDYAANGFGSWDAAYIGYGGESFHPVPADYDGDGKADLSVKGDNEYWGIDYAKNGFGHWDVELSGYGSRIFHPVPADYDGDKKADLSVKGDNEYWGLDYAANGFGLWDRDLGGYGSAIFVPAAADFDGDGKADIAVKGTNGYLGIDLASNGHGLWDLEFGGRGGEGFHFAPADLDGDGRADITVKGDDGTWRIDYAKNGFGVWDQALSAYGSGDYVPLPADYDGDRRADLCVKGRDGRWLIDYARNGFGSWDIVISP